MIQPDIFDYGLDSYNPEVGVNSPWQFSLRWSDSETFRAIIEQRRGTDYHLVILGSVGANPLGIRNLAMVAEAASTLEIFSRNDLGVPALKILYPIHANAWANGSPDEAHRAKAEAHFLLAQQYLEQFHPDLNPPTAIIDNPDGIDNLEARAEIAVPIMSASTVKTLAVMAEKKSLLSDPNQRLLRSVAYFLAHYSAYGWANYLFPQDLNPNHLFLLPQSEAVFQQMLEQEYPAINQTLDLTYQGDDRTTPNLLAYSRHLLAPPYYPHQGEPLLHELTQWPGQGRIFNHKGLNELAKKEVSACLEFIRADVNGQTDQLVALLRKVGRVNFGF